MKLTDNILDSKFNPKTNTLRLQNMELKNKHIYAIIDYLNAHPKINHLYLSYNHFDDYAIKYLVLANQTIEHLDLTHNHLTDSVADDLVKWTNLQTLNISTNEIGTYGIQVLMKSPSIKKLVLNSQLGRASIGSIRKKEKNFTEAAFAFLPENKTLQELRLSNNYINISPVGANYLAASNLKVLDLDYNYLEQSAFEVLVKNNTIEELSLVENHITDEYLPSLKGNKSIKTLILSSNSITDVGARILAECRNIISLNLGANSITSKGAIPLSTAPLLRELHLNNNELDDTSCSFFSKSKALRKLSLQANDKLTDNGIIELAQNKAIQYYKLTELNLSQASLMHFKNNKAFETLLIDVSNNIKSNATSTANMRALEAELKQLGDINKRSRYTLCETACALFHVQNRLRQAPDEQTNISKLPREIVIKIAAMAANVNEETAFSYANTSR